MQNGLPMKETRPSIRRGETPELKDNRHSSRKVGRETILHYALCIMHYAFESLPARAISTKNKHLLVIYSIPTRGFTAAVSVFRGTPPPKPSKCKIRFALPGDVIGRSRAHHTGECLRTATAPVLAKFNLSPEDITWMSRYSCSQIVHLSLTAIRLSVPQGKQKTLPTRGKQG